MIYLFWKINIIWSHICILNCLLSFSFFRFLRKSIQNEIVIRMKIVIRLKTVEYETIWARFSKHKQYIINIHVCIFHRQINTCTKGLFFPKYHIILVYNIVNNSHKITLYFGPRSSGGRFENVYVYSKKGELFKKRGSCMCIKVKTIAL